MTTQPDPNPTYTRLEWLQFGLFWSWNLVFLAFMALGFGPLMLPEIFTSVRTGLIPAQFLLYALVLALVPIAAVILGLTVLRRHPSRLFAMGYVVEGPLMLLLAVRFFAIRQANPALQFTLAVAFLGMAAFMWTLLDRRSGERWAPLEIARLLGLTLMALTSLYAAAWIAFYALPIGAEALRWLGEVLTDLPRILSDLARDLTDIFMNQPLAVPFSILGFLLMAYTATLFILAPIAVPYLSLRAWWRSLSGQASSRGWLVPSLAVVLILVLVGAGFVFTNRQPQAQAFAMLQEPPASPQQAQALLDQSESIRTGLLNAYLAPFRYISEQGGVRHIRDMYEATFDMPSPQAYRIQRLYESFASPLIYQAVNPTQLPELAENRALVEEPQEAAQLYQQFFDTPIIDAERQTILAAVRSTWSADEAESAWQAVDDREVRLLQQELSLQEYGDWAEAELHEVYQNQTGDQQEVIYYFNLPESAVITGVWLGNTPDKAQAFDFQVAPRGAAQAVYREQTRIMKDPALVEQIGPRQYRLRAYPVPPLRMEYDQNISRTVVEAAPEFHLWLAWRQMADPAAPDGQAWQMPRLAFLRNVYWDNATQRTVNGEPVAVDNGDWLPQSLPAAGQVPPQAHRVDLPGGQSVLAVPADASATPALPDALRLAVVLDRSRSMQALSGEVETTLNQLKELEGDLQPIDVYLTASPYRGEEPTIAALDSLDPAEVVYFGGQNAAQLIAQFEQLSQGRQYDAALVLTDGSGYELGESKVELAPPEMPVWLVHLGGELPLGYDDGTLDAVQASGGGVATSLDAALDRLAVSLAATDGETAGDASTVTDLLDGYFWSVLPTEQANAALLPNINLVTHAPSEPFAALAARRLILAEMQRNRGTISEVETLDALNALATEYGIVTPFSSMIVLVDDRQQQLLDQLSELGDRYQREVEELGDTTPSVTTPLTGVPEPHEWLLIGLVVAMLLYLAYSKRRRQATLKA
jgi:putative PEP-CTERM system integral membrane protein